MKNFKEITDYKDLENIIKTNTNVFLGNGFNICLGVDTSYKAICKSILDQPHIKKIIKMKRYKGTTLRRKFNKQKYDINIELHVPEIRDVGHNSTIKKELYSDILNRCKYKKYKYKEVISFLSNFKNYYTTNYDPLLYSSLVHSKNDEDKTLIESDFCEDLRGIHKGQITFDTDESIPLRSITKKQVYEIARDIFSRRGKYVDKKSREYKTRNDYFLVLKYLREEQVVRAEDGFVINPRNKDRGKYRAWDNSLRSRQTIFYLHGAIHIYHHEESVRKITLKQKPSLISELLGRANYNSCVFESTSEKKLKKISRSPYLKHCLDSLKNEEGTLVIVGWSCGKNDQHLIDVIKKSQIEKLIVSYHDNKTKKKYKKLFQNKELIFFHSSILPFAKRERIQINSKK